jgi:ASC-1-like (ASCH) protein
MSRRIVKKILPEYFDLILSGKKKYEFRVADFEVEEGDVLVLEEWDSLDHSTRKPTGRVIEKNCYVSAKIQNRRI